MRKTVLYNSLVLRYLNIWRFSCDVLYKTKKHFNYFKKCSIGFTGNAKLLQRDVLFGLSALSWRPWPVSLVLVTLSRVLSYDKILICESRVICHVITNNVFVIEMSKPIPFDDERLSTSKIMISLCHVTEKISLN